MNGSFRGDSSHRFGCPCLQLSVRQLRCGRSSSESAVLKIAEQSPLGAHITISIIGADGFTKAVIGAVKDDLDGRTVYHAAQLLSQKGPFLNVVWRRLQEKNGADLNTRSRVGFRATRISIRLTL
jgi:hypothetical protein